VRIGTNIDVEIDNYLKDVLRDYDRVYGRSVQLKTLIEGVTLWLQDQSSPQRLAWLDAAVVRLESWKKAKRRGRSA
jgi:hypothetical protein